MREETLRSGPRRLPPRIPKPGRGPISPPGYDDSLFSDPGLGGEGGFGGGQMPPMRTMDFQDSNRNGIDDRDEATGGPAPMPGGPVIGYPEQRLPQPMPGGGLLDRLQPMPQPMPIDRAQPLPRPMPGGGNLLPDDFFKRRPPGGGQRMPQPPAGAGSLFSGQSYDKILSDLYQDQYRNQQSPYAAQADYLMNRPVFDRGARTDNPMFTFEKDDPFATMSSQQYIRDEADAAALANQQAAQAEQERLAAEEAAAAQAAADAQTAEEAAIAAAEQERVAAEKAAADAATIAEADRIAAEMMAEQEAAAAAAAQQAAAAEAMAAQQAAEAESQRLAEEAEAQRVADLQARIDAMEGRFGNFDPATIRANIAAAAEAAEAAKATAAANAAAVEGIPAVDPDIQARIEALQEQFGGFNNRFGGFDPAAIQANIAAAKAAADANAATIAETPSVDPALQARIDAMQGELGGFGRRFEGFDPAAMQANIAAAKAAADANAEAVSSIPKFDDGDIQKRIADLSGRVGSIPQFDPSDIQARIDALSNREIPQFDPSDIQARIRDLGGRVNNISEREIPRFDDSAIRRQIEDLRSTIPTGIPAAEVPPMLPGTGTVPGVKINTDTLPGNLTGIGGGRATPLPKTRTRQTVKTPPPPTRTIMPVKPPPPKKAPTPIKRAPIKRTPIKTAPPKRTPIKPVKSAPPKRTTTKRPAPKGRVTDKRTRRGRGR